MERDDALEISKDDLIDFNSHAHVERDLYSGFATGTNYHFNSHAHVERDYAKVGNHLACYHFNSHAHVERDTNFSKVY